MPYIYKSGLQFGINETNIYGGASYVELTQAEYDALSDAEKHNGQIYFITDGNYDFLIVNDSVPIGSIQAYGGATAPSGWLICDGSAISRTDYKELFQAIGISFGEGDGGTTFNIPDLRGRITIGNGLGTASDAVNRTIGQTGGSEKITLSVNQIPSHSHTTGISGSVAGNYNSGGSSAQVSFNQTVGVNTGLTGGGQAHDNMQPYLTTNYIIKAKNPSIASGQQLQAMELFYPVGSYYETSNASFDPNVTWGGTWVLENEGQVHVSAGSNYTVGDIGGEATHTLTVNEMPSHTHSVGAGRALVNANGVGTECTAAPGTSLGFAFKSEIADTTGGSRPHNNMQPYIVVNRWHRTA